MSEFDEFAGAYDATLKAALPAGFEEEPYFAQYKIDYMARLAKGRDVAAILDFGCGPGRSLPRLASAFPHAAVFGYDPSSESVRLAAERAPTTQVTSDWDAIGRQHFDLVLVANVFHHIAGAQISPWLARCRDVLTPNGRIFVFEHNPWNPLTRRVFDRCPFDKGAKMIARPQLIALGRRAGLQRASTAFTLFFPKPLKAFRPLERWLAWLPLGAQYCVEFGIRS